jgi:hypothetical protein
MFSDPECARKVPSFHNSSFFVARAQNTIFFGNKRTTWTTQVLTGKFSAITRSSRKTSMTIQSGNNEANRPDLKHEKLF